MSDDCRAPSGSVVSRALGRWVLLLLGWRIDGVFPNVPRGVLIVAPHTSNWDAVVGLAAKAAIGLDANFLAKHTIFRGPLGPLMRWLGGMSLGLVPVADAASFSWAGPWIGWVVPAVGAERRAVVMFGVPSGVAWDPCGVTEGEGWSLEGGFVLSALDVALARPPGLEAPLTAGTVEAISVAPTAGAWARRGTAPSTVSRMRQPEAMRTR